MYWVYNLFMTLTAPIWVPWMWWRASRREAQPNWSERRGNYDIRPQPEGKRIWVHAVSVGEVIAALPLLQRLRESLPDYEVVLTVTTSSGYQTAMDRASEWVASVFYFPIDTPYYQLQAMLRVRPKLVAIMETELWFNFLWAAKEIGATTMLINGRISDRSFARSKYLRFFYRSLLAMLDRACMQTMVDEERIRFLGARNTEVLGNIKFDEAAPQDDPTDWLAELGLNRDHPIIVVGSTRSAMEERLVIDALPSQVQVVHAPRHLERAEAVVDQYADKFGRCFRRSLGQKGSPMVLDSYGELGRVFAIADLVIIGGGFDNLGGQNLLQPLAHGKPVLHGPNMQNFAAVAKASVERGASKICRNSEELRAEILLLLDDSQQRLAMGEAAKTIVAENTGATQRYVNAIIAELEN